MGHNFLIAAYIVTWVLQLGYLLYILLKSQQLKLAASRLQKPR
jgi:hypothetical protein